MSHTLHIYQLNQHKPTVIGSLRLVRAWCVNTTPLEYSTQSSHNLVAIKKQFSASSELRTWSHSPEYNITTLPGTIGVT